MWKAHSSKFIVHSVLLLFFLCLGISDVFAQAISSSELINNAKHYDGKIVLYAGEVVGDVMVRGSHAWVNLNDGENAIGIWMAKETSDIISYRGDYKTIGDWIEVSGIFHRACLEHGGDLDLHAQSLRKINHGRLRLERVNLHKLNILYILTGVLCLVLILRQLKPALPKR